VEADHRCCDMHIERTAFSGHRNQHGGIALLNDVGIDARTFVSKHKTSSLRKLKLHIMLSGVGNFNRDQTPPLRLKPRASFEVTLKVAEGKSTVLSEARDPDLRVRRSGCLASEDELGRAARVSDSEHSAHIIGVVPVLEQKADFDSRVEVSFVEFPDFDFAPQSFHGLIMGDPQNLK
jgi:hypothetical protein